jgi:uncharacterized protein (DUF885 family)
MSVDRRALLQTSAATLALQALPSNAAEAPDAAAQRLLQELTDQLLRDYPESATSAGVDKHAHAQLRSKLSNRSASGQGVVRGHVRATLSQLRRLNTGALSAGAKLDVDVVQTAYQLAADGFEFAYGDVAVLNENWSYRNSPYVVAQNVGAFVETPSFLDSSHAINEPADADAYLSRLEAYGRQLDGETVRLRADAARGVVLPDFLMAKTLSQLRSGRAAPYAQWSVVASLARRGARIDLAPRYALDAARIAEHNIAPALDRQIAMLTSLQARADSEPGVWKLPRGDEYYAWALRAGTTTDMTPEAVHQMGLDELNELHARMEPILRSLGYTEGNVGARMTALAQDPRYKFAGGAAGRAEIMAFIQDKLIDIRARLPRAFHTLVRGYLEVVRISPDVEAGAPGAYGGAGTIDGREPGHFWINLRTPDLHRKFSLPDLTYHEAIPGHVWQGEYTFHQPLFRSLLAFNAYSEGWALYAQQLADELGAYDDFPAGRLGYLQSLAFRACRLVVDTGIHAKRWTRAQCVDFFVSQNGDNPGEVESEVDRYCSWPGQACGYKVGHSTINRQRSRAQTELGDKYDFAAFNDAVVNGGSVPMTVLGRVIDGYIARARAA